MSRKPHAVLYLRLPKSLRAQIVGIADEDRRSVNMTAVLLLEDAVDRKIDEYRRKRAEDPARNQYRAAKKEITAMAKRWAAPDGPPLPPSVPLPDDLTAKERAMLGLVEAEPEPLSPERRAELRAEADEAAKRAAERLKVAEQLIREGYFPQSRPG